MIDTRPLSIPMILGTPRQGRLSEHVARVAVDELCKRDGMQTTLIDVRDGHSGDRELAARHARAGHGDDLLGRQCVGRRQGVRRVWAVVGPGATAPLSARGRCRRRATDCRG